MAEISEVVDQDDRAEYAKWVAEETRAFELQGSGADCGTRTPEPGEG